MNPLQPRTFLLLGGIILVLLAVLGFVGILGPTAEQSMLGELFYLTGGENVAHLLFGVVALGAYWGLKDPQLTKWLVLAVGIVALLAAVYGLMVSGVPPLNAGGVANLETPADTVLHLVVAVWAFAAGLMGTSSTATTTPQAMPQTPKM